MASKKGGGPARAGKKAAGKKARLFKPSTGSQHAAQSVRTATIQVLRAAAIDDAKAAGALLPDAPPIPEVHASWNRTAYTRARAAHVARLKAWARGELTDLPPPPVGYALLPTGPFDLVRAVVLALFSIKVARTALRKEGGMGLAIGSLLMIRIREVYQAANSATAGVPDGMEELVHEMARVGDSAAAPASLADESACILITLLRACFMPSRAPPCAITSAIATTCTSAQGCGARRTTPLPHEELHALLITPSGPIASMEQYVRGLLRPVGRRAPCPVCELDTPGDVEWRMSPVLVIAVERTACANAVIDLADEIRLGEDRAPHILRAVVCTDCEDDDSGRAPNEAAASHDAPSSIDGGPPHLEVLLGEAWRGNKLVRYTPDGRAVPDRSVSSSNPIWNAGRTAFLLVYEREG
jgi:hypothetical protein